MWSESISPPAPAVCCCGRYEQSGTSSGRVSEGIVQADQQVCPTMYRCDAEDNRNMCRNTGSTGTLPPEHGDFLLPLNSFLGILRHVLVFLVAGSLCSRLIWLNDYGQILLGTFPSLWKVVGDVAHCSSVFSCCCFS